MKEKLNTIKNNPEFQKKLQEMKPSRSIWGVLGVVLFFFVPEFMSYFYSPEINHYLTNLAQTMPSDKMASLLTYLGNELFNGEVSWINIGLGIAFLVWLFRK